MPATIGDLAQDCARLIIWNRDHTKSAYVDYRPGAVTPRVLSVMARNEGVKFTDMSPDEQMESLQLITQSLATLVLASDLETNDHQPIVWTVEGLQDVDYVTQGFILGKIQEDVGLGEQSGLTPSGASSTPDSKDSAPRRLDSSRTRRTG